MGKAKKRTATSTPAKPATEPKLAFVEQGLIALSQKFTQEAKKFAEDNGASVHITVSLIPTLLEESAHGSK